MKSTQAINEIKLAMKKEKDRRMFERYQAIYLHLKGKGAPEIAETIGRTERTVYKYMRAYRQSGIDGLQIQYSPGAAGRLTKQQQDQLKRPIVSA